MTRVRFKKYLLAVAMFCKCYVAGDAVNLGDTYMSVSGVKPGTMHMTSHDLMGEI